jgi:thiol-disulfide isomerase/thioredoxin
MGNASARKWLAGVICLLWANAAAAQQPTVEQMLTFQPKQKGVTLSTPAADEYAKCKVELVQGTTQGTSGWVLRDPQGRLLRRFFDSNADKYPDQYSYFRDGLEVYREVDTNANRTVDRYCWLNTGGMKIGVDKNEDGTIDDWAAMSVEELSQEVTRAIVNKDYAYLRTMMITSEDLRGLTIPQGEIVRIQTIQQQSETKFKQTCAKLANLNDTTKWLHVEAGPPSRLPADAFGMKKDVLMLYRAFAMVQTGAKSDWIQLGEMVLVGETWKIVDAPVPGTDTNNVTANQTGDTEQQALLKKLADHDAMQPKNTPPQDPALMKFYLARGDLIELLIAKAKDPADKSLWLKQLADTLSSAAQASPTTETQAFARLAALVQRVNKELPGTETASYITFRELTTEYNAKVTTITQPQDMIALQQKHIEKLIKFATAFPKSDEAADALWQLGMNHELQNKEADAKKWYDHLVRTIPAKSPYHAKAMGALRRLNLEGKPWELTAPVVALAGGELTQQRLQNKVIVVYYWASWCRSVTEDFGRLKKLAEASGVGLEIVCINVDEVQAEATNFLTRTPGPGIQVYAAGGPDGPVSTYYGLIAFPQIFLIGKDGKVISRSADLTGLDADVKKALGR